MIFKVGSLVLHAVFCLKPISNLRATQLVDAEFNSATATPLDVAVSRQEGEMSSRSSIANSV